jgi:hypothetical protein
MQPKLIIEAPGIGKQTLVHGTIVDFWSMDFDKVKTFFLKYPDCQETNGIIYSIIDSEEAQPCTP